MDGNLSSQQPASPYRKSAFLVLVFTAGYLLPATLGAVLTGNLEFVFYIAVMLILMAVVMTVHHRVNFSDSILWGLSIWGLLHMAGGLAPAPASWPIDGEIRVLYSWWIIPNLLKYDQVIHAYGFGLTTMVCWHGLRTIVLGNAKGLKHLKPTPGMLILCSAASMGFGALNEVIEFTATLIATETNVGGYINTGWDLVFNMLGAVSASLLIWFANRKVG